VLYWEAVKRNKLRSDIPPSGPWVGYYLYGHGGPRHRMKLGLVFTGDGKIQGDGVDDVARFVVDGFFNGATSQAIWTKAYVGMHKVEYAGFYAQRAICGDWTIARFTGGFWIWPEAFGQSDEAAAQIELAEPAPPVLV